MNLIDKEHIVGLERRKNAGEVTGLVEHRTAGNLESHPKLIGNDIAQCGLSQSGRTIEGAYGRGFATVFGGLYEHAEVVDNVLLSAEIVEFERAQGFLKLFLGRR